MHKRHAPPLHCTSRSDGVFACNDPHQTIVEQQTTPLSDVTIFHYLRVNNETLGTKTIECRSADLGNNDKLHCYVDDAEFGGRVYEGKNCIHYHLHTETPGVDLPGVPPRINLCKPTHSA